MIFLVGAVRYHVVQGQRGQFMARFLSPQVRSLVRERGLLRALEQTHLDITIVCCEGDKVETRRPSGWIVRPS